MKARLGRIISSIHDWCLQRTTNALVKASGCIPCFIVHASSAPQNSIVSTVLNL